MDERRGARFPDPHAVDLPESHDLRDPDVPLERGVRPLVPEDVRGGALVLPVVLPRDRPHDLRLSLIFQGRMPDVSTISACSLLWNG